MLHAAALRRAHEEALRRAHEEALKSVETFRLGAAVISRRSVVAAGRNRNLNSCGLASIHAEMDALFKAPRPLRGTGDVHVVVVRVLKDGSTALSMPCEACARALRRRRVCKVTYTTGDPGCPVRTLAL